MTERAEVIEAIREAIKKSAQETTHPPYLLQLAEALAWTVSPGQPHGGQANASS